MQPNPFDGPKFEGWTSYVRGLHGEIDRYALSVRTLKSALEKLHEAAATAAPGSQSYLAYMTNRTESYVLHLQTLISWDKAYIDLDEVFQKRTEGVDRTAFVKQLDGVLDEFKETHNQAEKMAEMWTRAVDHPSDLGVLYRIDTFMVTGTELTAEFIRNIDNFHHGRDYIKPVPFEKIFVDWVLRRDEQRQF